MQYGTAVTRDTIGVGEHPHQAHGRRVPRLCPLLCRSHEASSSNGFRRRVEKDQWYFKFAKESIDTYVIKKFQFNHMVHFFLFVSLVLCCSHVEPVNHGITYFRVYCSKWSNCLAFYRIRVLFQKPF